MTKAAAWAKTKAQVAAGATAADAHTEAQEAHAGDDSDGRKNGNDGAPNIPTAKAPQAPARARGAYTIPTGGTVLNGGDRVVVITTTLDNQHVLEKFGSKE